MTRPSTRACRQKNSFEGGFVRKFLFFLFFFKINSFPPPFLSGSIGIWRVHLNYTGDICGLFRLSFLQKMIL